MKVLVTGGKGFIGSHLAYEFTSHEYNVICTDLKESEDIIEMDIMNQEMIQNVIKKYNPDIIINLAGQANVGLSWKIPQLTMRLNTIGMINILEAVKRVNPKIRVIAIGSSDEYGNLKDIGENVSEDTPVKPVTPYAISKYAQELFSHLYVNTHNLDVCMIRLFNLGGSGQARGYMISDFTSEVAEVEAKIKDYILVGNLEASRDFTHVKDACRAIRLIAEKGHKGEVYNICSGTAYKAQEILEKIVDHAKVKIEVRQDPSRMRPSDTPVIFGNHTKLTDHTGWMPQMGIDQIITDALDYWRNLIARGGLV